MAPMLDEFRRVAESVAYAAPRIAMFGNVDGRQVADELATADYWVRHVLAPVRFADGIAALGASGIGALVELGPKPVLIGFASESPWSGEAVWVPSLDRRPNWETLARSAAALHVRGVRIDWAGFDAPHVRRRVALPTYPFQRERYWLERPSETATADAVGVAPAAPEASAPRANLRMQLAELDAEAREAALLAAIEIEVGQVLGLASVPAARPLQELGFDSIMAVELRDRIASLIERPVPATLVFDHPTLERQVRFLLQLCGLLEALDAAPDATRREAAQFESIAQLSDQEAIAALQSRLHDISEQLE
jgi:acyl transferase domain-containing protein